MLEFNQDRVKQRLAGVDGPGVLRAGRPMRRGDEPGVRELFDQVPQSRLKQFLHDERENVYKSTVTKPLGRGSLQRPRLPESTTAPDFRFGIKQTTDEVDAAKRLIFPSDFATSEKGRKPSAESHQAHTSGKTSGGNSTGKSMDLLTSFGKSYLWEIDGAKKCFSHAEDTKIVSKAVEEFRRITHPPVGKCTPSLAGRPRVPEEFAFGKPLATDLCNAAECLTGSYSISEQLPDSDLGRPRHSRQAARLSLQDPVRTRSPEDQTPDERSGDGDTRKDAEPLKRRRLSGANPGNELGVGQLLTPQQYESWGVLDEDFMSTRTRVELSELVTRSVGLTYADEPLLQQSVIAAAKGSAAVEGPRATRTDNEGTASLMDVLNVYSKELDKRIAEDTCSLTQTTRLKIL
ncbi:flagella related protein [Cystoisospora suis]|uniref:Flagella related protein n=1 Tax=Cystoisospora suis TaxID=483139 RepID=A0A2C6L393_9APIC|nr:flagella related protein [Cystoisospora suis]